MRKAVYLFLIVGLVMFFTSVSAEYKIILKNGRQFIVDEYQDTDGKIRFYKGGGEVEIDKANIETIKEATVKKKTEEFSPAESIKKDSTEETVAPEKGGTTLPKRQEAEDKLQELVKKKTDLKAEGEKLIEEKKKLEEELRKEGRVYYMRDEREYKRRISELEEKIRKFNEDMNRLDQEYADLLKQTESK